MFLLISDTILKNKQLNAIDKLILALITSYNVNNKDFYVSCRGLSKIFGIDKDTANNSINKLINLKLVKTFKRKNKRILVINSEIKDTNGLDLETFKALEHFKKQFSPSNK